MSKTFLNNQEADILVFAQKWRVGMIEDDEFNRLNSWYYALEGMPLSCPDEMTVEKVEQWLHKQFFKPPSNEDGNGMRPPWHSLRKK